MALRSFDDFLPAIEFEGELLDPYTSKIDVLVPALGLEDTNEDFILDLHYSLDIQRSANAGKVVDICDSILGSMGSNPRGLERAVGECGIEWPARDVVAAWRSDLQRIRKLAVDAGHNATLKWCRRGVYSPEELEEMRRYARTSLRALSLLRNRLTEQNDG